MGLSLVDLDVSNHELDLVSDRNEYAVPTSPMAPGLDPEMIEVQVGEEKDFDDMPLSLCLQISRSGDAKVQVVPGTSHSVSRCNLRWCMKVDAVCNTCFSDPPD